MHPRHRSALLWGVVGTMVFLVGHQAYLLAGGEFLGIAPVAATAVTVLAATTTAAHYAEGRLGTASDRLPADDGG